VSLADRVARHLDRRHMSQRALAAQTGIPQSKLSRLIEGRRVRMSEDQVKALEAALVDTPELTPHDLPMATHQKILDLKTRTGATSEAEVIRRAIDLYATVIQVGDDGKGQIPVTIGKQKLLVVL
jgi:transcriptional regulator with XRE-family HTH domain